VKRNRIVNQTLIVAITLFGSKVTVTSPCPGLQTEKWVVRRGLVPQARKKFPQGDSPGQGRPSNYHPRVFPLRKCSRYGNIDITCLNSVNRSKRLGNGVCGECIEFPRLIWQVFRGNLSLDTLDTRIRKVKPHGPVLDIFKNWPPYAQYQYDLIVLGEKNVY
jgi:hypothetical protein